MNWKEEYKIFLWILGFFLFAYFMPIENESFANAILAAFDLAKWYAQEHVLLCLIPAFFIAGTIAVFVSQASVIKYFGAKANKWIAYLVAAGSGTILAVCSCTVLPLFSSIHKRGAGLGPAVAFLYSGPAINILAQKYQDYMKQQFVDQSLNYYQVYNYYLPHHRYRLACIVYILKGWHHHNINNYLQFNNRLYLYFE
jgi:hypothetical protein